MICLDQMNLVNWWCVIPVIGRLGHHAFSPLCCSPKKSSVSGCRQEKKFPKVRAHAKELRPTATSTEEVKLPDSSHLKKNWKLESETPIRASEIVNIGCFMWSSQFKCQTKAPPELWPYKNLKATHAIQYWATELWIMYNTTKYN